MNAPRSRVNARGLRRDLLAHFDARARDLPWRRTTDPYAILVSEVMLQQTRVETVKPYYRRWMERFPTPAALAAAEEDEVLRLWEGLGYYSRARNLHRAVREVQTTYGGRVPDDLDRLRALPGIGAYTAGAVASIAFDRPTPAIDGNARRVLARLFDLPAPSPAELERLGAGLVDPDRPGAFNQALMELGATLCTPRSPACGECPVRSHCAARRAGTQEERPRPRPRREVPRVVEAVAVVVTRSAAGRPRVLVQRRPGRGLLAGMWELPGREIATGRKGNGARGGVGSAVETARALANELARTSPPAPLSPVAHAFSHRRVRYLPFLFETRGAGRRPSEAHRWVHRAEADGLAFPRAQRRILAEVWATLESAPVPFARTARAP